MNSTVWPVGTKVVVYPVRELYLDAIRCHACKSNDSYDRRILLKARGRAGTVEEYSPLPFDKFWKCRRCGGTNLTTGFMLTLRYTVKLDRPVLGFPRLLLPWLIRRFVLAGTELVAA